MRITLQTLNIKLYFNSRIPVFLYSPKDHWTLKTGYFEDPTPAMQIQTLPLEGPRSLGSIKKIDVL